MEHKLNRHPRGKFRAANVGGTYVPMCLVTTPSGHDEVKEGILEALRRGEARHGK